MDVLVLLSSCQGSQKSWTTKVADRHADIQGRGVGKRGTNRQTTHYLANPTNVRRKQNKSACSAAYSTPDQFRPCLNTFNDLLFAVDSCRFKKYFSGKN